MIYFIVNVIKNIVYELNVYITLFSYRILHPITTPVRFRSHHIVTQPRQTFNQVLVLSNNVFDVRSCIFDRHLADGAAEVRGGTTKRPPCGAGGAAMPDRITAESKQLKQRSVKTRAAARLVLLTEREDTGHKKYKRPCTLNKYHS